MYGHVITKFSRMSSLPHFLPHGDTLRAVRARELRYNLRNGPLENLFGAGGGGGGRGAEYKKYSRKGKLNDEKKIYLKKCPCYSIKKIHTGNLITKKNSCDSKIAPLPYPLTFLMVRPLNNKTRTIIFGIQLVNLITVCSDRRDIVECADKGMKVFDTGQFDFS